MTRVFLLLAASLFASQSLGADVIGDAEAGAGKAAVCAACHGMDGHSPLPNQPNLAGQHERYIVARLKHYKAGLVKTPNAATMTPMSLALSEQDMADLGAHFAAMITKPGEADPNLVDAGAKLYRLGNEETGVASCAACHGPRGHGNPDANMPALTGQHAQYTILQLEAFAAGQRDGGTNKMMHDVAKTMSKADMEAVASFIQGLH